MATPEKPFEPDDVVEYVRGYVDMKQHLENSAEKNLWSTSEPTLQNRQLDREIVKSLAIEASEAVGMGLQPPTARAGELGGKEYDSGARRAIMEWSHNLNHELLEEIRQSEAVRVRVRV